LAAKATISKPKDKGGNKTLCSPKTLNDDYIDRREHPVAGASGRAVFCYTEESACKSNPFILGS